MTITLLLLASIGLGCPRGSTETPTEIESRALPPNIILYVVDTLRADALGRYGRGEAASPNLDALADEGVLFESAWANASWTRASVGTLLTGLYPWHHGAESRSDRLPATVTTLAEVLGEHGYSSALVNTNPNVGSFFGFGRTFDTVIELYEPVEKTKVSARDLITSSDVVTAKSAGWLASVREPFFLVVVSIDPHAPYIPPKRFDPRGVDPKRQMRGRFQFLRRRSFTPEDQDRIRELYAAEVAFNDESLGELLSVVDGVAAPENTIVVVTSDHGEEFWEHGLRGHGKTLSDEVLHVPLLIRHAGNERVEPGRREPAAVQLVDVLPTVLDLAGLPVPDGLDGRALFGADADEPRPALAGLRLDGRNLLAARAHPWKLIWDRNAATFSLIHMESKDVPADDPEAARASRELVAVLESVAKPRDTSEPAGEADADVLPQHVEESLRALGYIE